MSSKKKSKRTRAKPPAKRTRARRRRRVQLRSTPAQLLAQRIRRARTRLGLTQTELARRMGCHAQQINLLESGSREPSLGRFRKLVKLLDVTPGWLLG